MSARAKMVVPLGTEGYTTTRVRVVDRFQAVADGATFELAVHQSHRRGEPLVLAEFSTGRQLDGTRCGRLKGYTRAAAELGWSSLLAKHGAVKVREVIEKGLRERAVLNAIGTQP